LPGAPAVVVDVHQPTPSPAGPGANPFAGQNQVPGVGKIVAVASGKGGVGKSTVSVNLACALQHLGARVGLLDCDIYGPSIPLMMGTRERPTISERELMVPPSVMA
jgi:ATP-binding protein involved in chromosome partitioning